MTSRVAFLGPAGTFTEQALYAFHERHVFGSDDIEPLAVSSPAQALDLVRAGEADFAVVAIENSVDGAVTTTYDALVEGDADVQIYFEHELSIEFSILTRPGTESITSFATHPVAHQQVRHWLAANLPDVTFVPASSNAAAAEMVAQGTVDAAAAPARAGELFGLSTLASSVADASTARTRFVVVGPRGVPTARTGNDTTLVAFTLPNEPGTLVGALQDFSQRGVDLSRISSRPNPQEFGTYLFYVDLVGHIEDVQVAEALRALWLRAESLRFLGSWPNPRDMSHPGNNADLEAASAWVEDARHGQ